MVYEYTVFRFCLTTLYGVLVVLLAGSWAQAEAAVYRWVDEDGNVHFSDTRPEHAASEPVKVEPTRNVLPSVAAPAPAVSAPAAAGTVDDTADAGEIAAGRCRQARIDRAVLDEAMPVYVADDGGYRPAWSGDTYRGEREYVADEARPQHVARADSRIQRFCPDPDDQSAIALTYNAWIREEFCRVAQVEYQQASASRSRTARDELDSKRREMERWCGT